jgi:hypothetical protein
VVTRYTAGCGTGYKWTASTTSVIWLQSRGGYLKRLSQSGSPRSCASQVLRSGKNVLLTLAEPDGVARVMDALDRLSSYVPVADQIQ